MNSIKASIYVLEKYAKSVFGSKNLLLFFFLINFLIYFDRTAIGASLPGIKKDLNINQMESGTIGAVFMIGYMILSPYFAHLEGKYRSGLIMASGLLMYCLSNVFTSISTSYIGIIISRALIGIAEAAYSGISTSYVDTMAPEGHKTFWLSIYFSAMAFGAASGYIVSGIMIAYATWRITFLIESISMFPLSVTCALIPDAKYVNPDSKLLEEDVKNPKKKEIPMLYEIFELLTNKTYLFIVFGNAALNFATGALAFWCPTYILQVFDLPIEYTTMTIGGVTIVTGIIGTLSGGKIIDRYKTNNPVKNVQTSLRIIVGIVCIKFPFMIVATITTNTLLFFIMFTIVEFLLFCTIAPVNGLIMRVVSEDKKTIAIALQMFISHLFGDFPSPFIIGFIMDLTNMRIAMISVSVAFSFAIVFFVLALLQKSK